MKRSMAIFAGLSMLMLISVFSIAFSQGQSELANPHKVQHRLRGDNNEDKNKDAHPGGEAKPAGNNGILYHGGPLILGTTNMYYIWYGNWSANTAQVILDNLATSIGGSPYFNINTTYYNGSNVHVSNSVHFGGEAFDLYSQGTAL